MTSRKRKSTSSARSDRSTRRHRSVNRLATHQKRRKHVLETLEPRRLLAGPQLIGIQPNDGELIVDGTVRDTAPRTLTFRFDQTQQIDPTTLDAIEVRRAGPDDAFDTIDDVIINPGSAAVGPEAQNEVIVRFAESLPDDRYRIEVFGFDDPGRSIIGLRNQIGELLVPRTPNAASERVEFELRLGAQIEAIVPQPVVRLADGTLSQRRDEILVHFNDDDLFVENDPATGLPTDRSAENPRFYQLLLTQETVRTTDDVLYFPDRVIYDAATNTARLIFADDLNELPGVDVGGGTFRLRIGTAVDNATDLIVEPTKLDVAPRLETNLGAAADLKVEFISKVFGESVGNRAIRFADSGAGGLTATLDPVTGDIVYDFGGATPTVQDLRDVTLATPAVDAVVTVRFSQAGVAGQGGTIVLPAALVGSDPLRMVAAGDTLTSATDVGMFGNASGALLSSIVVSESIDPQPVPIQLPGALTDPGRNPIAVGAAREINERFGPDVTDGVTEIEYNFRGIFSGGTGTGLPAQLNGINPTQKQRVREAIELWSNYLGVQFRETENSGVTFAVGNRGELMPVANTDLRSVDVLDADLRIDPTFGEAAIVFSNQVTFDLNYGENFFRKVMAGIGFLLGLEQNDEVTSQTLMALDPAFLNDTINPNGFVGPIDPFIPIQASHQQAINPNLDAQTIGDPLPNSLEGFEPVFPGNQDILHGRLLHRPDSVDVDLYRFEVALDSASAIGKLTVESFAERLGDSSLLDTALTLFQDTSASATTDFGLGPAVEVTVVSQLPGRLGNRSRIDFIQSDRSFGNFDVRVDRIIGEGGEFLPNAVRVDLPRLAPVTIGEVIDAINGDEFASTLFEVHLTTGDRATDISGSPLESFTPIRLSGGGTVPVTRNDDYFSNDSLLTAQLSNGVYYLGVAASGNDQYDPALPNSGFGGRTQGDYELLIKFEPQLSRTDVIRDLDSDRAGVPGTVLDGDLDGVPGGVKNFWFQTRPLQRILDVTSGGDGIIPGQTVTVTGANNATRRFEFVLGSGAASPGNVAVNYELADTADDIANRLSVAINNNTGVLGVNASVNGDLITLTGEQSLSFSNVFRGIEAQGRTLFVDKLGSVVADGSLTQPFNNIAGQASASAFSSALPGDIVRIVGNGGQDNNLASQVDNFSYQIGLREIGGGVLPDGRHMDVPRGVTTMIDAGAAFKLRSSTLSTGSNNLLANRNGGVIQVLGTPKLLRLTDPSPVGATVRDVGIEVLGDDGNVVFTSTRDRSVDAAAAGNSVSPSEGNWGGIIFRSDFDRAAGRVNLEDEGIFLQVVNHADIRFGGGSNILINSVQQTVNPIQIVDTRPTVTFNRLTDNAGAAMSASPDAFLETRFQSPRFQQAGAFTADYGRIGPDIRRNLVTGNSINGLFIRTVTAANEPVRELTVAAHIDDVDIVHYIAENVIIAGRPGGPIQDGVKPDLTGTFLQTTSGGSLSVGDYQYRLSFVDGSGFESLPSDPTAVVTTTATSNQIQLLNLPAIPDGTDYLRRRLYRLGPGDTDFRLIAVLNRTDPTFVDDGSNPGGAVLDLTRSGIRGRLDGSLVIDPDTVVKFRGARLELGNSTQLLAEGLESKPVIFTSALDDRFGAGGSFDTNEDSGTPGGGALPRRGDWAGIYAGPTANVSFDHAVVAYGGGVSLVEGGQSRGFAPLELQQASARVTNSRFEFNDHAQDGSGPVGRNGRLAVTPATIFARSTQPIIVGNEFVENSGAIIDIDLASMTDELVNDAGRQTGPIDQLNELHDNYGPLIRHNTTENTPNDIPGERQLNGLRIRAGQLTSGSVWDDTDIAHVLFESVIVGNQVSGGSLTLKSRPDESLVVKMTGRGTPNSATAGTGITATGSTGDIQDRIGGSVYVLGLPGAPVVLTSLQDDTVGAGRRTDGVAQVDTNGDGFGSRPQPNDWRSLFFDGLSNDRNVAILLEQESSTALPPGLNSSVVNAQLLGDLAERLTASDDRLRLGFEVNGFISAAGDIDTYSFTAAAGTQIWVDVDRTSLGLDTMIEIVDDAGRVLARSDNSFAEVDDPSLLEINDPDLIAGGLADPNDPRINRWDSGLYDDNGSTNLRDAGLRVTLPGAVGTRSEYFVRVRAASTDSADIGGGQTSGAYRLQVRLQQDQEFPGSVVRFADIRFANHGVHVQGLPGSSPLLGEAQENESADPYSPAAQSQISLPFAGGYGLQGEPRYGTELYANNDRLDGGLFGGQNPLNPTVLNQRPQNLGDLVDSKTGTISVGGQLSDISDIDFYQIDIDRAGVLTDVRRSTTFDVDYAAGLDRPDTNLSVFYSPTGNPRQAQLVLFGEDSNVLDDQASPLPTELVGELLERGSLDTGDPMIGPVALPAGSYFVAVTESGRVPTELVNNPRVRRSPVDSSVRIFDDHVESVGGTTAAPPVETSFVDTLSPGWVVTTDRSTDRGHDRPRTFSGTTQVAVSPGTPTIASPPRVFTGLDSDVPNSGNDDLRDSYSPDLGGDFVPDTLILEFQPDVPEFIRSNILNQEGLTVSKTFRTIDSIVVTTEPEADIPAAVRRLSAMPEIRFAEPDYVMRTEAIPNDPLFGGQWHYNNTGQVPPGGTPDADIDAPEAWDTFTGSPNAVIAVIDSGIDLTHPDLVGNLWVNPGEIPGDGIDNDNNGYIDDINGIDPFDGDVVPQDLDGHGTHVSGTTAAVGNNGIGVTGVNQNAQIMALRACGIVVCSTAASIEAIDYATMMRRDFGVNVVVSNNSYGGGGFSIAQRNAIEAHNNEGIPFVAAAGNFGINNDVIPFYPASYDLDGIISVAASDANDAFASFSHFGANSVDLAAPGVDVLSTTLGGTYGLLTGTSMASPHVAGAVGLLAGFDPTLSVTDLKNLIMLGVDPIASHTGLTVTGGRLNLARSLALIPTGSTGNESIRFDRSEPTGQLRSTPFDLVGYSADDLPRLYLDYFVDKAANDDITVQISSDQQTTPVPLDLGFNDAANARQWRQAIASLENFAGHSGIVIEINYTTDVTNTTAEGLFLDNFIVGFAERGELVAGAGFGRGSFTPTSSGTPGHYQLEVRPASQYTETVAGGLLIERALAVDPRLIDPIVLSIPEGRGVIPYESFTIDVFNRVTGLDETLTFQFQPTDAGLMDPTKVDPAAIPVPYSRTDTQSGVVGAVRGAINSLADYAFFDVRATGAVLTESFDTNDRHSEALTLIAPAGDQIADGDTFVLNDGSRSIKFEFTTDAAVTFGNVSIPFATTDTAPMVAQRMIQVINSGVVQGNLNLRASTVSGDWDFNNFSNPDPSPTDARVELHGNGGGNFALVTSSDQAPPAGTPLPVAADGNVILSAIAHDGLGDQNTLRTQGEVIIENNTITEVRAIGIWSDPGRRGTDPEDDRSAINNFIQLPPVGNSPLGGVINFPILNDSVEGGLAPGIVAQNNIIDRAGYTGIKVDGETRPFVIEWNNVIWTYLSGGNELSSRGDIMVPDGFIFAIDAGGTRVVFEFEDISGAPTNFGGSGLAGGDGWVDGHVPVYYRLGEGPTYNPSAPDPVRSVGSTVHEMMMSLYESIQGSILVTNGLVELVRPTLGPSLTTFDAPLTQAIDLVPVFPRPFDSSPNYLDFATPAIYLEGVSGIYTSSAFAKGNRPQMLSLRRSQFSDPFEIDTIYNFETGETEAAPMPMMPIAEAPQPMAKLVNNTVRGADGTEGAILADGSVSPAVEVPTTEPNDLIANAIDTKLEVSHRGGYFADGVIGDNVNLLPADQDVDFFKVELAVGDRLIVDIDTAGNGPTTFLRLFDSSGIEVAQGQGGALPEYLNPGSSIEFPQQDNANTRDQFIDFTALKSDTYYVGVSSDGNSLYEAKSLTERNPGTGGTGDYSIAMEVLAPRSFVFSLDSHPLDPFGTEVASDSINGTIAGPVPAGGLPNTASRSLIGTTFTISQIPDYLVPTRPGDAYAGVRPDGNRVTFEFTAGVNRIVLPNGNINVPILANNFLNGGGGYRVPDIMRATALAINGYLNNPALPNHEVGNGPDGRDGPVSRVTAAALGGSYGDNVGIENMIRSNGCDLFLNVGACPFGIFGSLDYTTGFGHNRRESGSVDIVPNGTFNDSEGTTELYVLIENAAKIELSPEARAAGLKLGPDNSRDNNGNPTKPEFATESDQLLVENGILVSSGASATLLNNVVVNAHQSMVQEESSVFGFGGRIDQLNQDVSVKKGSVVAAGNAYQYDDYRNTQIRSDISWWVAFSNFVNRNPALDTSLSTDLRTGPSNIAGGNSDFNFVVQQPGTPGQIPGNFITFTGDDLLRDGAAGRFTPADNAPIIDSAVDALDPNVDLVVLNTSLGIPTLPITAPTRDHSGQLRADEPTMAPPGGIGANVFKDRGALDLADFVGPIVTLDAPLDNDFTGLDHDPTVSFVQRSEGVFSEFQILLQDLGDTSDPFVGSGIDDTTVVVSPIDDLRKPGANFALFENDRLLEEGIDYSFSFDESRGVVTLKPLAGLWHNDRAYRIALNNQDRSVLVAPSANEVEDGQQLIIVDDNGANLVFEFESGFSLIVPEVITLVVPQSGTNAGGLSDGDIFQINDGVNPVVVFEFNNPGGAKLNNTVEVPLPPDPTPAVREQLEQFLRGIASNVAAAIQGVVDQGRLNVDVVLDGDRVIVGGERGTTVITSSSGLQQPARTLALQVPAAGVGVGGIADGDTFVVDNGARALTFEFDAGNGLNLGTNRPVSIAGISSANDVAIAIRDAIVASGLGLTPTIEGGGLSVYLNLPVDGRAAAVGQLSVVGLSRPPLDGDLIVFTPTDGSNATTLEINRVDSPDNGPTDPNIPVNITRSTTASDLAGQIANILRGQSIAGINPNDISPLDGGVLAIGGEEGLIISENSTSFDVVGSPSVTGSSTIQVFGPLLLTLPLIGGGGIIDGSVVVLTDDAGNDVIFEFNLNNTAPSVVGSIVVPYDTFSTVDAVADSLVAAINGAAIGITAQNLGVGQVSLGRIDQSRVNIDGIPSMSIPGLTGATLRRGIVNDGEILTIQQGGIAVRYEFEAAVGGGGTSGTNVPVAFARGSSPGEVAVSLAAAINNNKGGLNISAVADVATGQVKLADQPGTIIDVSQAPTLNVTGVSGGATPIRVFPGDSATKVKEALLTAIRMVGDVTNVRASDRGGPTLFVEGAQLFNGPVQSYFLPSIKDLAGNVLKPNREDNTTQFTILLPTIGLDFGDAPDPRDLVPGRFPTLLENDGARHVVTPELTLGTRVDAEPNAESNISADGDDLIIFVNDPDPTDLFDATINNGFVEIRLQPGLDPLTRDGDTVSLTLGGRTATLEFDIDGIFDEEHFAVAAADPSDPASIALAIRDAINQSNLQPGEVQVDGDRVLVFGDDEDGVSFISFTNPVGNLNKGVTTPISVTVTGAGVVEAWIDFNADGDWDDPGEQIIDRSTTGAIFSDLGAPFTQVFNVTVPEFASPPPTPVTTYARFRVSREGGLGPDGIALSGEVEDYAVELLPGLPPQINQSSRSFIVEEDLVLQAIDAQGQLTTTTNDDGLLTGIVDPEGDVVAIFADDVGTRTLMGTQSIGGVDSQVVAGELNLASNGTFSFVPAPDFNGTAFFTARVTDVKSNPDHALVNSTPLRVTITVTPVNDPPFAVNPPVTVTRTIFEDAVQVFTANDSVDGEGLIEGKFLPGPTNEQLQGLVIDSAGDSVRGPFATAQGGTLEIAADGQSITYTPPTDYNGPNPDTFTYIVADVLPGGQPSALAATPGTVVINFLPVNDPPRPTDDAYIGQEDTSLTIPIRGTALNPGILDNDVAGPQDEIDPPQNQTIDLAPNQFPKTTSLGGSVALSGSDLIYTPPSRVSGRTDTFEYLVEDNLGATATGTVSINIGGVNNPPEFIGVNGDPAQTELRRFEAKTQPAVETYDLNTWFLDPEQEDLTFTVSSRNTAIVSAMLTGDILTLTYPPFGFGQTILDVSATDASGARTDLPLPVNVVNTDDPPRVIGSLDPLAGTEDQPVFADLSTVFDDPDGGQLQYSVARLGTVLNPTPQQIADHPLLQSISFNGDTMQIALKPNQSGSVQIELRADDGLFQVNHSFTLNVAPVPDNPIAQPDGYNVPIGSVFQIVNPTRGLLANDSDADGEPIRVDLNSVTTPNFGTVAVNEDGTFTYTSQSGQVGQQDSFQYRTLDSAGLASDTVDVTLNLNQSLYQNPIANLSSDVNADGVITALDALRILNFMDRADAIPGGLPVSQIGAPPPDYYDPDGDGQVTLRDVLKVIGDLSLIPASPEQAEGESVARFAVSTNFATADRVGLASHNVEPAPVDTLSQDDSRDELFAGGIEVGSSVEPRIDDLVDSQDDSDRSSRVDDALLLLSDEMNLD